MSHPIYPADVVALVEILDAMNSEQRKILLDKYCPSCGDIKKDDKYADWGIQCDYCRSNNPS